MLTVNSLSHHHTQGKDASALAKMSRICVVGTLFALFYAIDAIFTNIVFAVRDFLFTSFAIQNSGVAYTHKESSRYEFTYAEVPRRTQRVLDCHTPLISTGSMTGVRNDGVGISSSLDDGVAMTAWGFASAGNYPLSIINLLSPQAHFQYSISSDKLTLSKCAQTASIATVMPSKCAQTASVATATPLICAQTASVATVMPSYCTQDRGFATWMLTVCEYFRGVKTEISGNRKQLVDLHQKLNMVAKHAIVSKFNLSLKYMQNEFYK
jgi:hypothetical protein